MNYNEIFNQVALKLDLPIEVVRETYKAYWKYIRSTISELPLKDDLSEDEFRMLKVNFNIPSLGKIACTYDRYKAIKDRYKYIKRLRGEDDTYNKES